MTQLTVANLAQAAAVMMEKQMVEDAIARIDKALAKLDEAKKR